MERLSEYDRAVLSVIFDPLRTHGSSDFSQDPQDTTDEDMLDKDVLNIIKDAISKAESRKFDETFRLFDEALKKAPNSPSVLNDRAQALRLASRNAEALEDLHLAVKLSQGKGKAGIQALCQRGALYLVMNEHEKAKEDFTVAARAGSPFARSQLVTLNPYAAMCNAMLKEITFKTACHEV